MIVGRSQRRLARGRRLNRRPSIWSLAPLAAGLFGFAHTASAVDGDTVVLQGLDKVTARVWTFDAPIGREIRFGTLEIVPRFCDRAPPEEPPETAAFLEIYEARQGEERADLFMGWMFASSPGLNALEHPVYDVWVIDCKSAQDEIPPADGAPEPPAR